MIYFITKQDDPQISLFYKLAKKNKIPSKIMNVSNQDLKISFSPGEILLNNKPLEENALFYLHDIQYEFPHIPDEPVNNDWTVSQDFHSAQQQSKSHIYSLLSLLSENKKYKVVNDFIRMQKYAIKSSILELLINNALDVPDFILSNSAIRIKDCDLFNDKDDVLWSYPESGSPIRKINKKRVEELLKGDNPIPYIFFEAKKGYAARVIFFEKYPVLITLVDKPSSVRYEEKLEKFHYIKPHDSLQELGQHLFRIFGVSFYEIHGIIDEEDKFWFYDVTFKLNINSYSQKNQKYIISKLLEHFTEGTGNKVIIHAQLEENESRKTLFLKRMLNPLFELQQKTE